MAASPSRRATTRVSRRIAAGSRWVSAFPTTSEPKKYFEQIAQTMVQQGVGWYDGPPPGKNPFGTVIHTDTVFAVIGQNPVAREDGYVHVFGECRNMDDHSDGASVNVTDQLVQAVMATRTRSARLACALLVGIVAAGGGVLP